MRRNLIGTIAGGLLLASCHGGGGGGGGDDDPQAFSAFVLGLIENTADDTEPVSLEDLDVTFDEDPNAFDELFD